MLSRNSSATCLRRRAAASAGRARQRLQRLGRDLVTGERGGKLGGHLVDDVPSKPLLAKHKGLRRCSQVPNDAQPRQYPQHIIGRIVFPPAEALPGGYLVGMVVVVPALAQGQQRKPPVVAGIVTGDVASTAEHVGERCQTATVLQQKPTTSPGQPAISHVVAASSAAGR